MTKIPRKTRIKLGFYMFMCDIADFFRHPIKLIRSKFGRR